MADLYPVYMDIGGVRTKVDAYMDIHGVRTKISSKDVEEVVAVVSDLWAESSALGTRIRCVIYANGYWVVGGRYTDGTTTSTRIAYATNPSGKWTTKELWSDGGGIIDIIYADGRWVVGGTYYNGSEYVACIAYSTSLDGAWTRVDLWSNKSSSSVNAITYANGYWVVCGNDFKSTSYSNNNYKSKIAWATSLDGTWTTKDLWSSTTMTASYGKTTCVCYANGYWVVGGQNTSNSLIAYSTSLDGTWTTVNLWTSGKSGSGVMCITYANGYFVVGGTYYKDSTRYGRIAYATNPSGTWSSKDLWNGNNGDIYCITYADGKWVVGGAIYDGSNCYSRIAYSTSLDGTWTNKNVRAGSSYSCMIYGIAYENGYWLVGGERVFDGDQYRATIAGNFSLDQLGET